MEVGGATGPEEAFRTALRMLHLEAGEPSLREISRRIGKLPVPENIRHDAVHRILSGPRVPRWPRTAFLVAVAGGTDGSARVWDVAGRRELGVLREHRKSVRSVACAEFQGRPVAVTASSDGGVTLWDLLAELHAAS
ncbi:hypothetical protein [Streptomyces sp. NPDC051219]|uniref:hypothetical protein n=1 Tax=Streptomyces sp. NPDC051219 TaxID=3155283 RepID=UPI0034276264